jgi:hypothetical protein
MAGPALHSTVRGNGKERRSLAFRFFPNSTTNPVVYDPNDDISSVAYVSQCKWLVTLNYPVKRILGGSVLTQLATAADAVGQIQATSVSEGQNLPLAFHVILLAGASAATAISADPDNSVLVNLEVELV